MKFAGTVQSPDVSGRLNVSRGTVNYLQTRFKVISATADFVRPGTIIPMIRLNSEAQLSLTKVNMSVSGPLSAMEVHLSSEPAMSQQELVSLLTLRGSYAQATPGSVRDNGLGRDEVLGLLNTGLQMRFMAEAEAAFRDAFGLDEFRLIRGTLSDSDSRSSSRSTDREVYNLEISKYVSDRLYLSYNMGLDHREYTASFRYDLSRRVSLTGSIDEQNRRKLGIETRFTF